MKKSDIIYTMKTEILQNNYLEKALKIINNDGVIAFPTDTVYGLCCSAFSEKGIDEIYRIKGRENSKALIVMIPQNYNLECLVESVSDDAKKLIKEFWPGALTIIFKSKNIIPKNATGGLETVGVRIPNCQKAIDLLNFINIPLCTTSANISGEKSPISADEVFSFFNEKIPLIIDGGICNDQIPSTICDLSKDKMNILRVGSISKEKIEKILN